MVVDKSNRNDKSISEDKELSQDSGQKGGKSSDANKAEDQDMGGQDAGNMNYPQDDKGLTEES